MLVPDDYPEARAFIRKMQDEAAPYIKRRTVVLYGANERDEPYILGTGVPLDICGNRLIVTAAHVLDEVIRGGHAVYMSAGGEGTTLFPIVPQRVRRSAMPASGDRRDDVFDLAVIDLSSDTVVRIGGGLTFVTLADCDPLDPKNRGSYYFLQGFPSERLKVNRCRNTVTCQSLPYGTITYDGIRGLWPSVDDVHIDLDFHPRKAADERGRRVRLPRPHGISGCGIWRLSSPGVRRSEWTTANIKLVAIEHRYHSDLHLLRGTRIKYVNTILVDWYPECRAEMHRLWGTDRREAKPGAAADGGGV